MATIVNRNAPLTNLDHQMTELYIGTSQSTVKYKYERKNGHIIFHSVIIHPPQHRPWEWTPEQFTQACTSEVAWVQSEFGQKLMRDTQALISERIEPHRHERRLRKNTLRRAG